MHRSLVLGLLLVLVGALTFASVGNGSARKLEIALPNCVGKPVVRPKKVIFACADGGFLASGLAWTGWGERFAAADGAAFLNDCKPSCVRGTFHRYRVVLLASGRQRCPNGQPAYRRITWAFVGRAPSSATTAPWRDFPCRPLG